MSQLPEDLPPDLREAMESAQADPDYVPPLPKEELRPRAARLYRLLEALLFRGFLSSEWSAGRGRVRLRLKTLNLHELDLAREMAPAFLTSWERAAHVRASQALAREAQERAQLAFSIHRLDGINFLGSASQSREEAVLALRPFVCALRAPEIRAALRGVIGLARLSALTSRAIVPYSYGAESRRRWAGLPPGQPLCADAITGFQGTSGLGLNSAQEAWTWINRITDQYERDQAAYDLAKFQAGVHAGKEVRRLDKQERSATRERLRREAVIWAMADMDAWDPDASSSEAILVEDSSKDLLRQMERAVHGEKDYHDSIIQAHEERIRRNLLLKAAQRDAYLAELHEERVRTADLADLDPEFARREGGLLVVVSSEESDRRADELARERWARAGAEEAQGPRTLIREFQDLEQSLSIAERHHLLGPGPDQGPAKGPVKDPVKGG